MIQVAPSVLKGAEGQTLFAAAHGPVELGHSRQNFDPDFPYSMQSQQTGRGIRKVDDPVFRNRSAVIHPNHDGLVVAQVSHAKPRSNW